MPGATTRNHVLIRRRGRGMDGDLTLKKFGLQYNFTFTSSEGTGQALRSLVELGTIELYGKLLKLPYWTCLGLDDRDPGVAAEIEDWWESLRSDTPALLAYLATQMRARGLYTGQADGQLERPLELAEVYREGQRVAELGAGTSVGEMAYLAPSEAMRTHGADVLVAEPATTISFGPDTLEQLSLGTRALFDRAFIGVLVRRLHAAHEALAHPRRIV